MAELPQSLEKFIRQQIDSVGQLEALLLLFRSEDRVWQAGEVARRLYVGEGEARSMLGRLVDRGFLKASENGFMFRREEEGLTHRVQELERFYATHLIPISNLIHSKASARIQEFADAFTFKRKK